jgi:hypothetical protein
MKNKTRSKVIILRIILGAFIAGTLVFSAAASEAQQTLPYQAELTAAHIPQPQFFCGYCHVLTYPGVVKKGYELWKKDKHNKYGCAECHYPPQGVEKPAESATAETATKIRHIPKKPPAHFSYLQLGGETVKTRPRIVDASCMTASCHGNPKDDFKTKKIKFTEKVSFVHKPHLEKKNQIEGQTVNCTSCHQHETDQKKFEVSKATCHLCHFTNVKFNESRGRCELCHALPEKPIQTSGEKPITHEMLKKAKVSCSSCHIELIQASGGGRYEAFFEKGELKTTLVLGAGRMKNEACLACHDQVNALKEAKNKKLMHEKHVTTKNARCVECHRPIMHAKADLGRPLKGRPRRISCEACHSLGPKREGVSKTPDFMYKVGTNCLGCHVERKLTEKGAKVMAASGKTCVKCHTKDHEKMLKDWKTELVKNIKEAKEIEQEARETLAKHKSKLTKDKLAKANKTLKQGRDIIDIVQLGNGVHNKKYSIMLIDAAIGFFDDMIAYIEEGK